MAQSRRKSSNQTWREKRGACVILSEDCVPPTKWEVRQAAHNKRLARMIFGTARRRCLPEVAMLCELARKRWNWTWARLAKKMRTSAPMMALYKRGLIPLNKRLQCDLGMIIRLANAADMGQVEALEIWKRCMIPRQYEPYRAFPTFQKKPQDRKFAPDSAPAGYADAANHFLQEIMGGYDRRSWHWREAVKEFSRLAEAEGMTAQEIGAILEPSGTLLRCYWAEEFVPVALETPALSMRGEKPAKQDPLLPDFDEPGSERGEDGD